MKKHTKLAIIVILFGFLIRIFGINRVLFIDENFWAYRNISYHPPLGFLFYRMSKLIFGPENWAFRLVPLSFGILSIILVYIICKRTFNNKTALISIFLMSFNFWHVLASLQIDIDGSLLSFLFLLSAFSILEYYKQPNRKWLLLTGIFLGLSALTKAAAMIFFAVTAIFILIKERTIKKCIAPCLIIFSTAAVFPLLFFILAYLFFPDYLISVLSYSGSKFSFFSFKIPIYLLIWGGPLMIFLFLIKLIKMEKKDLLFVVWFFVPIAMYSFFRSDIPLDRYLMVIIPPLCILGGKVINDLNIKRKDFYLLSISIIFSYTIILLLNIININKIPHNINDYIARMINFQWNFFLPITGPSGPTFGLSFASLAFAISMAFVFLAIAVFYNKKAKISMIFILLFLGVGLALNIFMIHEFLFNFTQPNIDQTTKDLVNYYQENYFEGPVYSNTFSLQFYLDKKRGKDFFWIGYGGLTSIEEANEIIDNRKGTILIIDFPPISKKGDLWKTANRCSLVKKFYSKNTATGYIFSCASA